MRVIAGSRRSIPLATVQGKDVRPTTDRIKETLFNMISGQIAGTRFLDLFSGTGQIGIEALSRGAEEAVFVENDRRSIRCIEANLQKTRFVDQAEIIGRDMTAALGILQRQEPFDIIFLDPPYRMEGQEALLQQLGKRHILARHGLLILEADKDRTVDGQAVLPLVCTREKRYGTNQHLFFAYGDTE